MKQSAHATADFVISYMVMPYTVEEADHSDADDIYLGLGFTPEQLEEVRRHTLLCDQEDKIEVL